MFKNPELISEQDKHSYEYGRAQFLKTYLNQAEAMLDVHASFTPNSKRFAICENNAQGIIEYLPIDLIVSGFDEIEPGGTDYYMNSQGKIGICVECGYLGDESSTKIAEESIINFLKARGHITNDLQASKKNHLHMYQLYYNHNNNFTLNRDFADFEDISAGEFIGLDGQEEIKADKDSFILFARNTTKPGEEAFLLGEQA